MVEKVAELLLYLGTEVNARQIVYYRYDECNDTFTPEFGGGENFDAEKSGLIAGDNASGLRNFLTWQNIFFTSGKVDEKKMTTLRNWLPFELDKKCFLLSALKTDQQLHGMLFIRFRGERVPGILYLLLIRRTMRLLATLLTDELEKNDSERRLKRLLHNNRTQQKLLANSQIARGVF